MIAITLLRPTARQRTRALDQCRAVARNLVLDTHRFLRRHTAGQQLRRPRPDLFDGRVKRNHELTARLSHAVVPDLGFDAVDIRPAVKSSFNRVRHLRESLGPLHHGDVLSPKAASCAFSQA
jgi:hypothetical protein